MKKIIFVLLLFAGSVTLAYAGGSFPCGDHKTVVKEILAVKGQGFLATAITKRGIVLQVFTSRQDGSFSIIGIDDNGLSCLLLSGTDWAFAAERRI